MIDGDDLCFDYELYKRGLKIIKKNNYDLIQNDKSIITGLFTYIISYKGLLKTKNHFRINTDTEMAFKYFNMAKLNIHTLKINKELKKKKIRLTLDYYEDYVFFKLIYSIFPIAVNSSKVLFFLKKYKFLNNINYDKEINWLQNIKKK